MPFASSQSDGVALATLSSAEPVGLSDLTLALDTLIAKPQATPATGVLIDLTTLVDAHIPQAIALANHLGHLPAWHHVRFALLVSRERLALLERALILYLSHEGLTAHLFTDPVLARDWLIPPVTLPALARDDG